MLSPILQKKLKEKDKAKARGRDNGKRAVENSKTLVKAPNKRGKSGTDHSTQTSPTQNSLNAHPLLEDLTISYVKLELTKLLYLHHLSIPQELCHPGSIFSQQMVKFIQVVVISVKKTYLFHLRLLPLPK